MPAFNRSTHAIKQGQTLLQSLFECDIEDRILLSCHLLGKPTSAQLFRLHSDIIPTLQKVRFLTAKLSKNTDGRLAVIAPIDIEQPYRKLPRVFLDTTQSRRHIEKTFGVPYRRVPVLPSRDWRFLRHDVTLVDELISFELTARAQGTAFGYESHYDVEGAPVYPRVTITDGALSHTLQPKPDKTLVVGKYHVVIEHDCGEETIGLGHIMRDATIARKHLVYDQLERSGVLDDLGWRKRLYAFVIDSNRATQKASRKRIKTCLETLPPFVNANRIFFVDRQSFMEAGDDISALNWVRGDGQAQVLPCW